MVQTWIISIKRRLWTWEKMALLRASPQCTLARLVSPRYISVLCNSNELLKVIQTFLLHSFKNGSKYYLTHWCLWPQVYVQDVLRKQLSEEVWQVLYQSTGHLYVCGGMNMARDVAHTIQEILVNRLGITLLQAGEYLEQLKVGLLTELIKARPWHVYIYKNTLLSRNNLFWASTNLIRSVHDYSYISLLS